MIQNQLNIQNNELIVPNNTSSNPFIDAGKQLRRSFESNVSDYSIISASSIISVQNIPLKYTNINNANSGSSKLEYLKNKAKRVSVFIKGKNYLPKIKFSPKETKSSLNQSTRDQKILKNKPTIDYFKINSNQNFLPVIDNPKKLQLIYHNTKPLASSKNSYSAKPVSPTLTKCFSPKTTDSAPSDYNLLEFCEMYNLKKYKNSFSTSQTKKNLFLKNPSIPPPLPTKDTDNKPYVWDTATKNHTNKLRNEVTVNFNSYLKRTIVSGYLKSTNDNRKGAIDNLLSKKNPSLRRKPMNIKV
ncbi:hypothetical protein AYI70_g11508 [Smittium culicis]|uniref:Uncharacterized protein n=1 Tax=Smittium culicis TaxID=133412 RepID=A0A1R1X1L3_9FUNG|nr:hypothetical protein AYI70_g11508 [Smittium culicis]